ncbi:hypothetical protein, partial [Geobacillus subterraneus]|uniref:hypothetical protein n=1 Tax=Geobacillus subterraneus TaxID=129338 RepID=UPI001C88617E
VGNFRNRSPFLFTQFSDTMNFGHCQHPFAPPLFGYVFTTSTVEEMLEAGKPFFFAFSSALFVAELCIFILH